MTDGTTVIIANIERCMWPFDWQIQHQCVCPPVHSSSACPRDLVPPAFPHFVRPLAGCPTYSLAHQSQQTSCLHAGLPVSSSIHSFSCLPTGPRNIPPARSLSRPVHPSVSKQEHPSTHPLTHPPIRRPTSPSHKNIHSRRSTRLLFHLPSNPPA